MKKLLYLIIIFTLFHKSFSQPITVNTTTYTVPQLVQNVLFGTNGSPTLCSGSISNITSKTGSNFGSVNGIGYFQNTNSSFPLSAGVILSTGSATSAVGPNTSTQSNGSSSWPGDTQLFNYIDNYTIAGLPLDPGITDYNNASIIEFDFVPVSSTFSFDFVFASEEYGTFQCAFSDAFAFFLQNTTAGTPVVNLALVPVSLVPISVVTVRNTVNNTSCASANPAYFGAFNGGPSASTSATNFQGQTVKFTAATTVVAGNTYHIKLVVADRNDNSFDSAVFLGAGSFSIGQNGLISGTDALLTLTDFTNANGGALCDSSDVRIIQAGATYIPTSTYVWKKNGIIIAGATTNTLSVSAAGTYSVSITSAAGCLQADSFIVELRPAMPIAAPLDLTSNSTFNLASNIPIILNGQNAANFVTTFYESLADVQSGTPITNITSYLATFNGQIIYAATEDFLSGSGCLKVQTFILTIPAAPCNTITLPTGAQSVCQNGTPTPLTINTTFIGANSISFVYFSSTQIGNTMYTGGTLLGSVTAVAGIATYTPTALGTLGSLPNTPGTYYVYAIANPTPGDPTCRPFQLIIVTVNPLPTATITSSSPSACLNFPVLPTITLTGLGGTAPYTFTYTYNGAPFTVTTTTGNTVIINVPTGTVGPQTYVLTTVTDAFCSNTATGTRIVQIINAPIINQPTPYIVCDDNAVFDGIALFNLHSKDLEITTNASLEISYYPTFADATIGGTLNQLAILPGNLPYQNIINPYNQIVWIRVFDPNAPTCYSVTSLQLIVKPRPLLNLNLTPLQICDVTLPLVKEPFDLHTKDADIIAGQTGVVVNYYTTQALAIANVASTAISNQNAYEIAPTSATQTIWYNASFTASACGTVGPLKLIVNPLPNATQPAYAPYVLCETSATSDGIETFNLDSKKLLLALNQQDVVVTFYASPADAVAGTNQITANLYTNTLSPYAKTLGVRVTNIITGCYAISSIDLIVAPVPAPFPLPTSFTSICDTGLLGFGSFDLNSYSNNIINGEPNVVVSYHLTLSDATLSVNPLTSPYNNVNAFTQIIYVRATNSISKCYKIITIDLTVNQTPVLPTTASNILKDLIFCDADANNQNGATIVNLTTQTPIILSVQPLAASNYVITYYTTAADANSSPVGLNPIAYPATYAGTNNQTIWVRIENTTSKCFKVEKFKLIINIPLAITTPALLTLCDDQPGVTNPAPTSPPAPATTYFDLVTLRNPTILGLANPANFTINYYLTQADANAGQNPQNAAAFLNTSNPQTLFVVVTSNDIPAGTGGCKSFTTLTLSVLPIPTPKTDPPTLGEKCDDNLPGDLLETFNLTVNAAYITNNQTNVVLRYFPGKLPGFTNDYAVAGINEILNPSTALVGGNVWIRVESSLYINSQLKKCYTLVEQKLTVNPLPTVSVLNAIAHPLNTYQICQNPLSVLAEFNLTNLIPELLTNNPKVPVSPPTLPVTYTNVLVDNYTTTFYTTAAAALAGVAGTDITNPGAYESTAVVGTPQIIYVRVVNDRTGCVNPYGKFEIVVNPKPTITLPQALDRCDDDGTNDGFYSYPLNDVNLQTTILGTSQSPTDYTVTFHESQANANNGANAIADLGNYMGYTHKLWIRVQKNSTGCFEIAASQQNVEMLPEPTIVTANNVNSICVNYTNDYVDRPLVLELKQPLIPVNANTPTPANTYTYQWYEGNPATGTPVAIPYNSTGPTYNVDQAAPIKGATRYYTVKVTSNSTRGCTVTSAVFAVIQSGQAVLQTGTLGYGITNAFEENQVITVTVNGYGTYEYSLDDGVRQESPIFENVPLGAHSITVYDVKELVGTNNFNCEKLTINDVKTIDYPYYFTPNGDGINDFWNINGLKSKADTKIYIFDRDGKLVKQLSPDSAGWDGTFNGNAMPSSDYWFTVDFTEQTIQKQFKSHFSLKR